MKTKIKKLFSNTLVKKGIGDSGYYAIANIGSKLLGFLLIPIIARLVSIEEFATYDLFLLVSGFLTIVVTLGIDSGIAILISESKDNKEKLSFYYIVALVISMITNILFYFIVLGIFSFTDSLFMMNFYTWKLVFIYVFFGIINFHTFNFLRWTGDAKWAALINLFSYTLGVVIGFIFLYTSNEIDIINYLYGLVIGTAIGVLFSLHIAREYIFSFRLLDDYVQKVVELMKLSLPFVPNYIGNTLMQMLDRIVIMMFFGKSELGVYGIIVRLASLPSFILGTIVTGFKPVMYNNYKTKDGAILIKKIFDYYVLTIPLFFILAYLFSDIIIGVYGGESYIEFAYLLPIALSSVIIAETNRVSGLGFSIKRKTHYIVYITFISLGLNFILSISFAWWLGLGGILLGTLMANVFRTIFYVHKSDMLYSFGYNKNILTIITLFTIVLSSVIVILK